MAMNQFPIADHQIARRFAHDASASASASVRQRIRRYMRMLVRSNARQIVSHNSELSENWNFHFIVAILSFVCRKAFDSR